MFSKYLRMFFVMMLAIMTSFTNPDKAGNTPVLEIELIDTIPAMVVPAAFIGSAHAGQAIQSSSTQNEAALNRLIVEGQGIKEDIRELNNRSMSNEQRSRQNQAMIVKINAWQRNIDAWRESSAQTHDQLWAKAEGLKNALVEHKLSMRAEIDQIKAKQEQLTERRTYIPVMVGGSVQARSPYAFDGLETSLVPRGSVQTGLSLENQRNGWALLGEFNLGGGTYGLSAGLYGFKQHVGTKRLSLGGGVGGGCDYYAVKAGEHGAQFCYGELSGLMRSRPQKGTHFDLQVEAGLKAGALSNPGGDLSGRQVTLDVTIRGGTRAKVN